MNRTDLPAKIYKPFADSGSRNIIPVQSQIGITNGAASYTDGFPPLTMTDETLGGIAPDGRDMNGVLHDLSALARWFCSGVPMVFDQAFANAIGGYPAGAVLSKVAIVTGGELWRSHIDGNTNNPDAGNLTGWQTLLTPTYSAIEQGGGPLQLYTKLNIGMTAAAKLRLAVAGADVDNIALEQWVAAQILLESQARNASEAALQTQINTEAFTRYQYAVSNDANLNAEDLARQAADNDLYSKINAEETARYGQDVLINNNLAAEVSARIAGDNNLNTSLTAAIAAEGQARISADTITQNSLQSETYFRTQQVTDFYNRFAANQSQFAHQYFTPGDAQQINLSLTFTNNRPGYLVAHCHLTVSAVSPQAFTNQLHIYASTFAGVIDSDRNTLGGGLVGSIPLTGDGGSVTVLQVVLTETGGSWPAMSQHLQWHFYSN